MSKKIIETLNLADEEVDTKEIKEAARELTKDVKRDIALSVISEDDLEDHDNKMNLYAQDAYMFAKEIYDVGMDVEPRHASEMFNAAANMMKIAMDAKSNKLDKRLKLYALQLKKQQIDAATKDPGMYQELDSGGVMANREDILNADDDD